MPGYRKRFSCRVVTPAGQITSTDAVSVSLPGRDGAMGILGGHAPMVSMIGRGLVSIEPPEGHKLGFFVAGGFAHVADNVVTIIAEQCEQMDQIDSEALRREMDRAKSMPDDSASQRAARDEALARARTKFAVVQTWRRQDTGGH
ncbi:MAG: ATP synthase F1 subunit epsilon [Phycisphaerae bacterium]|nr:ATP synthase F1 subunit epsilon [Phycisphaerae bacterium]